MKRQSAGYGQAGGKGQGQPYSRFQIEGDPTPYIPLWAAGGMVSTVPAHLMGDEGGAYYYGTTKVGGITNMVSNGEVLRPIMPIGQQIAAGTAYSLLLDGGNYDRMTGSGLALYTSSGIVSSPPNPISMEYRVNNDGEICSRATAAGLYGAQNEPFTMGGITASVANGSNAVTFSGAVNALPLTGAYAYTPMFNAPRPGDLLEIVQAGTTRFYRILTFPTNATCTIFPTYSGAGGAGLSCTIRRTGFGSSSSVVSFVTASTALFYYCGNQLANANPSAFSGPGGYGTIECAIGSTIHRMAPLTTPSASNLFATDIAYYKSFLLYMFGGTIGWSAAGFPFGGTLGFTGTDFPDLNVSVIDTQDSGIGFEFLGDQLVAFFSNSAWLVQATGIVPEFAFYRLPQIPGAWQMLNTPLTENPTNYFNSPVAPITRSANRIFFQSEQGLSLIDGAPPAKQISVPVENFDWSDPLARNNVVTYSRSADAVLWREGNDHTKGLINRNSAWTALDLSAIGAVKATSAIDEGNAPRQVAIAYWNPTDTKLYDLGELEIETTSTSLAPWKWATPIAVLGQAYGGFKFGGFEIWARGATGVATANLNWSIYSGTDPYHMTLRQGPTAFNYAAGFGNSRQKLGVGTIDDPFIGFVLTGSLWTELTGIVIYPSDSKAGA